MLELTPMKDETYAEYLTFAIEEYAKEKIKAGAWAEAEAEQLSADAFSHLLPEGLRTKGAHLFDIRRGAETIGYFWIQLHESPAGTSAFIYDFLIHPPFRGQGLGKQAMLTLDAKARELGASKISLHVFAHNQTAFRLYGKVGYEITDYSMSKKL